MARCFFVSDLHGDRRRYDCLVAAIRHERTAAVLLGGDLLPHGLVAPEFFAEHVVLRFERLRRELGSAYPRVFLIFGNDDPRSEEAAADAAEAARAAAGPCSVIWRPSASSAPASG